VKATKSIVKLSIIPAAAGAVALLCVYLVDVDQRARMLQRFVWDNEQSVDLIVSRYAPSVSACRASRSHSDIDNLAAAFVTVESFATPTLDAWARSMVAKIAAAMNMTVPDITIGPGRIRLRTARDALRAAESQDGQSLADRSLVREVLSLCGSTRVARAILNGIMQQDYRSGGRIDFQFIHLAARIYNGQAAQMPSIEARISADIYFNLVYQTFQHYRFNAL
jgi:hypothetical protein